MIDQVYIDRFWTRFQKDRLTGCWIWTYSKNARGYGQFMIGTRAAQRRFYIHRLSWILTYGPIPNGMLVCHRCDNTSCGNPDHLFIGTAKDNSLDMMKKGRHKWVPFKKRYNAKLNQKKADHIRSTKHLLSIATQARLYNVSRSTIKNVRRGRSWNVVDKVSSRKT